MRDLDDGRDYSFVTTSFGGRRAVEQLCAQIANMRWQRPGAVPLVRLDTGSFQSKTYGKIASPSFTVTGWVTADGQPYNELKESRAAPQKALPDDDIPF